MPDNLRILMVEDSEDDEIFVLRELRRGGYEPQALRVETEDEFTRALDSETWEIVIADFSLPQFNALEALRLLQESGKDIPFIIVSGAIGEEVAVGAMKSGAHDYILKSSLARLVPAVQRELREARVRSERRKAEESCAQLAAIVESTDDAIIGKTLDGVITTWNASAERIFGYSAAEAIGKPLSIIVPPDRSAEMAALLTRLRSGETIESFETVRLHKSGRRIDVSVTVSPIKDTEGRIVGASKIARDITERKRAQTTIAALSRLGQNLSSASTPLDAAIIIGNISDDLFGWDACSLDLYSAEEDSILTVLNVDTVNGQKRHVPSSYANVRPSQITRQVIEKGAQLILREESNLPPQGFIPFGDISRRSAALIFVPIRNQTKVIGVLSIQSYTPRAYLQRDLNTMQTLADYCGGALERIRAIGELKESEDRFRRVVESDLLGIIFWESSGHVHDANDRFLAMSGYSRNELRSGRLNWLSMTPAEHRKLDEAVLAELSDSGASQPFEKEFVRRDGTRMPVLVGAAALTPNCDKIVCFVLDITERKEAAEALLKSEERYRKLSDCAPIGIIEHNSEGRCTYVNPRWTEISGLGLGTSLDFGWLESIHPEDRKNIEESWRQAVSERRQWSDECRLQTPQGLTRWVRMQVAPVSSEGGTFVGTVEDISRSRRAADALRAAQERLRHLVSSSPAVLYALKVSENRFLPSWVSENIAQLTGYGPEETLNAEWWAAHLDIKGGVDELANKAKGDSVLREFAFKRKDGAELWIRDERRLLRNAEGKLVEVVGSWSDITNRRRAEEVLRASREELRALAARLESVREEERKLITREIHDELGQSLTGFKMDLAWMRNRLQAQDVVVNREALLQKIATMGSLLDGTANLVRKLCTELRPGVLDDLGLAAAIEWQAREYSNRTGIRCSVEVEWGELTLDSERSTAIFRIFQEILTNVARHAHATTVDARLKRTRAHLLVEVRDNGRGISEQEKVGSKSLGLLGMRERALIFGGGVEFEGSPGRGTVVRVTIPLPEDSGHDAVKEDSSPAKTGKRPNSRSRNSHRKEPTR